MTEHPHGMTPAELKVAREFLGLTGDWLAGHLGVPPRTYRRWEEGTRGIPDAVRLAVAALEAEAADHVTRGIGALAALPDPGVLTYRSDTEYHTAHPEITFPASWHRAVVARIAQEVAALQIAYASDVREHAAR